MKMHTNPRRIHLRRALLAHGDHEIRALLRHALERAAYEVTPCCNREELSARLEAAGEFQLLVCEVTWLENPAVEAICEVRRTEDVGSLVVVDIGSDSPPASVSLLQPDVVIRNPLQVIRHMARIHVDTTYQTK